MTWWEKHLAQAWVLCLGAPLPAHCLALPVLCHRPGARGPMLLSPVHLLHWPHAEPSPCPAWWSGV